MRSNIYIHIYIADEDILQETYETIFTGNPAFPASTEVLALPARTELIGSSTIDQNDTAATDNTIPMGSFPVLEPPVAPPPPLLPYNVNNATQMTWFSAL